MSSTFHMKYPITNQYIENPINRPKTKRPHTLFVVAHDTGNINSTARNNVNYMNRPFDTKGGKHYEKGTDVSFRTASAHVFIDDKEILVGVPIDERAWHVLYNVTTDNKTFGDDANDAAVGVELCFFADLNRSKEAYKRFAWYCAYLAHQYGFTDIKKQITFHSVLDPGRKVDPKNSFDRIGVTYDSFLNDVIREYKECKAEDRPVAKPASPTPVERPSASKHPLSVDDANKLIHLCKREWAEGDKEEKAEWARLANKLRYLSGQEKQ